jgi:drug/metabolite transporter (DMT)-like permease
MAMTKETKGMLIGFIGVAIFSLTLPFTRIAVQEMTPFYVSFGRGIIAGVCGALLLLLTKSPLPTRSQFKKLLITALGVVYGFPIFTSLAMKTLPSAHSGIVLGILPLAMSAIGAIRFRERPSFAYWVTAVCGTLLVLVYSMVDGGGLALGDIWLLLAIVTAAIGYSEGGKLAEEMGAIKVISWAMAMTLPINIPATYIFANTALTDLSTNVFISFLYIGLFSAFIGFFFWYRGIALGGVARVGQVQLLQPFLTLIGAYLLLGEPITLLNMVFAIAVLVVVLIGRKTKIRAK